MNTSQSCPLNTDLNRYLTLVCNGNYQAAVETLRQQILLPQVVARLSHHAYGAHSNVMRFVAERADHVTDWDLTVGADTGKQVAIVGAGPAGAQAAVTLRKLGHQVTILEKRQDYGGMLRYGIPEYELPYRVLDFEFSYLEELGIKTQFGVEVGQQLSIQALQAQYDAVILANGAELSPKLDLPGSDAQGVHDGLALLSSVTEQYAFAPMGNTVAVIGDGRYALACARSAVRLGADTVYLCSGIELLNSEHRNIALQAIEEGVQLLTECELTEIATERSRVSRLTLLHKQQLVKHVTCDTLINAVARQQQQQLHSVDSDKLFICNRDGSSRVIHALAAGRSVALQVHAWLADTITELAAADCQEIQQANLSDNPAAAHSRLRPAELRKEDFAQVDLGLNEAEARSLAASLLSRGNAKQ